MIIGFELPWPFCLFQSIPGAQVDDAREGSWGHWFMGPDLLSFLVFVGVDMDGLACPLLWLVAHIHSD
jgi:hypothetical protein